MARLLASLVDSAVYRASMTTLRELWEHLGAPAAAATADLPRLTATLDQHAAAVRDALCAGAGAIGCAALAGYARGILDGAGSLAWHPAREVNWPNASWLELRLATVALLARHHGHVAV